MMNYPFPTPSPYMHAAMSHAVQAMMAGASLPPNCMIMAMPMQHAQQMLPQLMMNAQQAPYYGPPSYINNHQPHAQPAPQNYNYPIVPYQKTKKRSSHPQQPHPNIYNSSSFDSYMHHLSWSRLFDRPSRKNNKPQNSNQTSAETSKKARSTSSSSSSSSSSTTSDETIRRVNVTNRPAANLDGKQQTKGSLPFKYSSEFVPGIGKQPSQKIKSHDVFFIKKQ